VLVTSVSGDPPGGEGEWGDSALVEVDGQKIPTTPAHPPSWYCVTRAH